MLKLLDELDAGGVSVRADEDEDGALVRSVLEGCTWGRISAFDLHGPSVPVSLRAGKLKIFRGWFGRLPLFVLDNELIVQHLGAFAGLAAAVYIPGGLWVGIVIAVLAPLLYLAGVAATLVVPLEYERGSTTDLAVAAICSWAQQAEQEGGGCAGEDGALRRELLETISGLGTSASRFWFTLHLPHTSHNSR